MSHTNNVLFVYLKSTQTPYLIYHHSGYGNHEKIALTFNVRSSLPDEIEKQYKTLSSPAQYINSPRGEIVAQMKEPPSRLPDENDLTICVMGMYMKYRKCVILISLRTCPCMFMITTVLERLQTTKCSGFLGSSKTALTANSWPRVLKVDVHSVVLSDQILTVPSEEPLENIL